MKKRWDRKRVLGGLWMLWMGANGYADPAWWAVRGVLSQTNSAADYAPVNQGQLKHVVRQAKAELDAKLPGGSGSNIAVLVNGFQNADNYASVNGGQLKNMAKPFYDRLWDLGMTNAYPAGVATKYPWNPSTNASDYSIANVGQLKYLFSFDIGTNAGVVAVHWASNQPTERVLTSYTPNTNKYLTGFDWWSVDTQRQPTATELPAYRRDVGQSFYVPSNTILDSIIFSSLNSPPERTTLSLFDPTGPRMEITPR